MPENEPELPGVGEAPDSAVITAERKRNVELVMEELPAKDRLVIRQVFFEDRDKDEICAEYGVSREYLRVLLHRAKARFKDLFEKRWEAKA